MARLCGARFVVFARNSGEPRSSFGVGSERISSRRSSSFARYATPRPAGPRRCPSVSENAISSRAHQLAQFFHVPEISCVGTWSESQIDHLTRVRENMQADFRRVGGRSRPWIADKPLISDALLGTIQARYSADQTGVNVPVRPRRLTDSESGSGDVARRAPLILL
jgi:hypothetical protein